MLGRLFIKSLGLQLPGKKVVGVGGEVCPYLLKKCVPGDLMSDIEPLSTNPWNSVHTHYVQSLEL